MRLQEEDILDAAIYFERANGNVLSDEDASQLLHSKIVNFSVHQLESLIIEAINCADSQLRSQLYWALGKRFNTGLLRDFNRWLEYELENGEARNVYQILIALDNLEIQVFGKDRNGSYSYNEDELNFRDARNYIENCA